MDSFCVRFYALLCCFWLCIGAVHAQSEAPEEIAHDPRRHTLSSSLTGNLIGHTNIAYDFRFSKHHAVGLDVMYAPRFVWISPGFEESVWTFGKWDYGRGSRFRLAYKLFPVQEGSLFAKSFFLAFRVMQRAVKHTNSTWDYQMDIGQPTEYIQVNSRYDAIMKDFGGGVDIPIENFTLGCYFGWSWGWQRTEVARVDGGPLPEWAEVENPERVGFPRFSISLGYSWGKNLSSER